MRPIGSPCSGVDVSVPEEHLAPMIEAYNRQPNEPLRLNLAVPSDFEAVVAKRKNLDVFRGELNPIFQGTYSSRIELKQEMRDMERLLTTAETLGVLAERLGGGIAERMCWPAWEPVLFNETHDLASGVMTDHVYEDTLASYAFSRRLANQWIDKLREQITAKIDTRGDGIPIVVFNTLGWPRTDVAEATVGIAEPGVHSFRVEDADGKEVPVQLAETARRKDGGIETGRLIFLARDVPALGYCVLHAIPQKNPDQPEKKTAPSVDGEFYRLTIDPSTGAVTSLVEKAGGRELLAAPANVISRETDQGDLWELYQGLDGGSAIAMKRKQPVPRASQAKLTSEFHGPPQKMRAGSVFAEFRVAHPFDTGSFETRIRCYHGLPRIDIWTTLVNNEKYVRYQALFPTAVARGKIVHSIPFGSIERPEGIEFPAQDWVDYSDAQGGLALLNRGLPGNLTTDGTMMVSLLRSHTLGAYGFGGGYEPGMSSESGRQLGKARTVQYALYPHPGDWRAAKVFRAGLEFNRPLIAAKATTHTGELPQRWGLLEVTPSDVVVSALKPGRDGTAILRVYEATPAGRPPKTSPFNLAASSRRPANAICSKIGARRRVSKTTRSGSTSAVLKSRHSNCDFRESTIIAESRHRDKVAHQPVGHRVPQIHRPRHSDFGSCARHSWSQSRDSSRQCADAVPQSHCQVITTLPRRKVQEQWKGSNAFHWLAVFASVRYWPPLTRIVQRLES